MTRANRAALLCHLFFLGAALPAFADGGFATRDLNPLLQPIYLPTLAIFSEEDGWRVDHSLYITNTLQQQTRGDESLLIDVENYRYELGLRYRHDKWLARLELPFVGNSGGELDGSIENWHDFFGLPQGARKLYPRNQINLDYRRGADTVYHRNSPASGLGDIAIAVGYQPNAGPAWFAGVELATGSIADLSGNEAIDTALWVTNQYRIDAKTGAFTLLGVSFPGSGDYLQGLVAERIWLAQAGLDYRFDAGVIATLQFDLHSSSVEDSRLTAFGNSLQMQLGLGFPKLFAEHRLDLFFSEDILVGSAPDISFGLRLSRSY
jgi:hypothetical protein